MSFNGQRSRTFRHAQIGFSLLEVLVAMTITGLALGALLAVIAGNKRLSFNSESALLEATQVRSLINLSQLIDGKGFAQPDLSNRELLIVDEINLEVPERKTQASLFALRGFEIETRSGDSLVTGSYWVQLERPE